MGGLRPTRPPQYRRIGCSSSDWPKQKFLMKKFSAEKFYTKNVFAGNFSPKSFSAKNCSSKIVSAKEIWPKKKSAKNFRQKMFAENIFGKKKSLENVLSDFSQTACFGGALIFWTSPSDAPRKFIARHIGFSLLRPLAEGQKRLVLHLFVSFGLKKLIPSSLRN